MLGKENQRRFDLKNSYHQLKGYQIVADHGGKRKEEAQSRCNATPVLESTTSIMEGTELQVSTRLRFMMRDPSCRSISLPNYPTVKQEVVRDL